VFKGVFVLVMYISYILDHIFYDVFVCVLVFLMYQSVFFVIKVYISYIHCDFVLCLMLFVMCDVMYDVFYDDVWCVLWCFMMCVVHCRGSSFLICAHQRIRKCHWNRFRCPQEGETVEVVIMGLCGAIQSEYEERNITGILHKCSKVHALQ